MPHPFRFSCVVCLLAIVVVAQPLAAAEPTESERAALELVDRFMDAFNRRDEAAWSATLNYPHVRVASGQVKVWNTPEDYQRDFDFQEFAQEFTWAYSRWDERRVIQSGPDKVHLAVRFTRYKSDDTKLATFDSLYVVTKVDGRWGVQVRSSFAP